MADTLEEPAGWGLARRIGFRFAFCYLGLCIYSYALGLLPWFAPALWNMRLFRSLSATVLLPVRPPRYHVGTCARSSAG